MDAEASRPLRKRKPVTYCETKAKRSYEFVYSPVPLHIRPILSAAQRSAKKISKRARKFANSEKSVKFVAKPVCIVDITPRSEKKVGSITMPESPPFPYSRTTFFNLLADRGIVDANIPERDKYIKADIELKDLGLSPEIIKTMRDFVEKENRKDNGVYECVNSVTSTKDLGFCGMVDLKDSLISETVCGKESSEETVEVEANDVSGCDDQRAEDAKTICMDDCNTELEKVKCNFEIFSSPRTLEGNVLKEQKTCGEDEVICVKTCFTPKSTHDGQCSAGGRTRRRSFLAARELVSSKKKVKKSTPKDGKPMEMLSIEKHFEPKASSSTEECNMRVAAVEDFPSPAQSSRKENKAKKSAPKKGKPMEMLSIERHFEPKPSTSTEECDVHVVTVEDFPSPAQSSRKGKKAKKSTPKKGKPMEMLPIEKHFEPKASSSTEECDVCVVTAEDFSSPAQSSRKEKKAKKSMPKKGEPMEMLSIEKHFEPKTSSSTEECDVRVVTVDGFPSPAQSSGKEKKAKKSTPKKAKPMEMFSIEKHFESEASTSTEECDVRVITVEDFPSPAQSSRKEKTKCSWESLEKKLLFKERDCAPYPSLCHVGVLDTEEDTAVLKLKSPLPDKAVPRSYANFPLCQPQRPKKSLPKATKKRIKGTPSFDAEELNFFTRARSLLNEAKVNDWCSLLRPHTVSEILGNAAAVEKIRSWLLEWKERIERRRRRESSQEDEGKSRGKRKGKRESESDSDDDFVLECGEDLCNTLLLSGPVGCGKTALINGIAEELGMAVMVSAANEKRSGANLKAKLEGALDTHRISSSTNSLLTMLGAKSHGIEMKAKEQPSSTIVVIEDADLSFMDDNSFWPALRGICTQARVPVVISCEDRRYVEDRLNKEPGVEFSVVEMSKASSGEIAKYIRASFAGLLLLDLHMSPLLNHIEFLKCDLRASINSAQFYGASLPSVEVPQRISLVNSTQAGKQSCHFLSSLCADRGKIGKSQLLQNEFSEYLSGADDAVEEGAKCVRMVQFAYVSPQFYSISTVATEILPLLKLMDTVSNEEMAYRRRVLHHFDRAPVSIDPHGEIRRFLSHYNFPGS